MTFKIRTVIVDDEPYSREELKHLLGSYEEVEVVAEAGSAEEGLEKILFKDPDVIFVDMEMPRMSGTELVEAVHKLKRVPLVIFATAYPDYAIKAFRLQALDYLLKPFSDDELADTMSRVYKSMGTDVPALRKPASSEKLARLAVEHQENIIYLSPDDILYASAVEGETAVVTKERRYISKSSLKDLEQKLSPHHFFRTHKSYLVNLRAIKQLIPWFNGAYQLKVHGADEDIPVSRNYIKALREQLEL
ncbi:LytR/AlgR family response regulator transcription factor [Paenibacillus alkalitolerans]|uniref:LytR/AlgR family response regulator transcription factor n=1 Tax=Paenibacillus alkalitolerans TaxID=2799335 RepID=UPI0018F33C9B|nr:LytTR family DNA-binding domain-containing protein [Paenibacillus alkalitolerans]